MRMAKSYFRLPDWWRWTVFLSAAIKWEGQGFDPRWLVTLH